MLKKTPSSRNEESLINPEQARWVHRVLGMLIAVVGKESLLGLMLGQTRLEIRSLLQSSVEPEDPPAGDAWFLTN